MLYGKFQLPVCIKKRKRRCSFVGQISIPEDTSFHGIDLAKFIMAVLVVVLHSAPLADISSDMNYLVMNGVTRIAVPYFFAASGFLLFHKMPSYPFDLQEIKKYLRHIFRLYIVWIIIYSPLILYQDFFQQQGSAITRFSHMVWEIVILGWAHLWFLQALIIVAIFLTLLLFLKIPHRWIFFLAASAYIIAIMDSQYDVFFQVIFPDGSPIHLLFSKLNAHLVITRNGIFHAPIFFFMGAYLGQQKHTTPFSKSVQYALFFFVLFLIEVTVSLRTGLTTIHSSHECYFTLVPLTYFIFLSSRTVKLPNLSIWKYLRKQSMFIYYIHVWWWFLVISLSYHIHIHSSARFFVILSLSILSSHILIILSKGKRFSFLKYLF